MKRIIVNIGFKLLGKGFEAASYIDNNIYNELKKIDNGYKVLLIVGRKGPALLLKKEGDVFLYTGSAAKSADLVITLKNLETGFMLITTQSGISQAYAEQRISLQGNVSHAMMIVRCLNIVERYLFPGLLAKRIIKRVPRMSLREHYNRVKIYFSIFTGKKLKHLV